MRMKSRVKAKKEAPKENKVIENAVTQWLSLNLQLHSTIPVLMLCSGSYPA